MSVLNSHYQDRVTGFSDTEVVENKSPGFNPFLFIFY